MKHRPNARSQPAVARDRAPRVSGDFARAFLENCPGRRYDAAPKAVTPRGDVARWRPRGAAIVMVGGTLPRAYLHGRLTRSAVVAAIALGPATGHAEPLPTPLDGWGHDLVEAASGYNLAFYGGAVAATGVMAFSGLDQDIRVGTQEHLASSAYSSTAFYAGIILPASVAPGLYLLGIASGRDDLTGAGSASLQALVTSLAVMTVLKIGVGRVYPLNGGSPAAPDRLEHPTYAHTFYPFQSAWPLPAWPSGHTLATLSVAAALTGYFPDKIWVPLLGYPLALGIGFGLVVGDRHWASDVVAGALIGHAIGYSIGRSFRLRARAHASDPEVFELVPWLAPGRQGVLLRVNL